MALPPGFSDPGPIDTIDVGRKIGFDPVASAKAVEDAAKSAIPPITAGELDPVGSATKKINKKLFNAAAIVRDSDLTPSERASALAELAARRKKGFDKAKQMPSRNGATEDEYLAELENSYNEALGRKPKNPFGKPEKPEAPSMPGLQELDLNGVPDNIKSFAIGRLVAAIISGQDPAEAIVDALTPVRLAKAQLGAEYERDMKAYEMDMERYRYDTQSYNSQLNAYIRGEQDVNDYIAEVEKSYTKARSDYAVQKARGLSSENVATIKASASKEIAQIKDSRAALGQILDSWDRMSADAQTAYLQAMADAFPAYSNQLTSMIGLKNSGAQKYALGELKLQLETVAAKYADERQKAEIAKIKSGTKVDDARASQILTETRYYPMKIALEAQALSISAGHLGVARDRLGLEAVRLSVDENNKLFKAASDDVSSYMAAASEDSKMFEGYLKGGLEAHARLRGGDLKEGERNVAIDALYSNAVEAARRLIAYNDKYDAAIGIKRSAAENEYGDIAVAGTRKGSKDLGVLRDVLMSMGVKGIALIEQLDGKPKNPTQPQPGR